MKCNWKKLALAVAIPLAVGGLSALLTMDNMVMFDAVKKPPLSPPKWLFPAAWTVLYILMGIASYLVCTADAPSGRKRSALVVYAVSLVFNFLWSIIFLTSTTTCSPSYGCAHCGCSSLSQRCSFSAYAGRRAGSCCRISYG